MTGTSRQRGKAALRGHARRTRTVRRASAGLSPARAGGALAMLLSAAAIYGVAASPAFGYARLNVTGLRVTDRAAVDARLELPRGANLFTLSTDALEDRLRALPTIADARVTPALPDALDVAVEEREAILAWQVGDRRFLADRDGILFAQLGGRPPAGAAALPVVDDRRAASRGFAVGARLAPIDLDAATRLGSLRPVDLGSSAARLRVAVTDAEGFVVGPPTDGGWTAAFGFYTPSLRTPDMIPGQVRLLRTLLAGREGEVERVVLASETDGTYVPRAAEAGSPSPGP